MRRYKATLNDMITRLRDIYSAARIYGSLSETMEDERRKYLASLPKRTTQQRRAYLDGYWRCLIDQGYERGDLIYGGIRNGKFYSVYRERDDYYEKHGISAREFGETMEVLGHYWARNLRGFFVHPNKDLKSQAA